MLSATDLTPGERLCIDRRRRNETQRQAARRLGMPLGAYKLTEDDNKPACWRWVPAPPLGRLRDFERFRILRQRRGWTLDELADRVGLSKWWCCLIEQGKAPASTLAAFWTP